MSDGIEGGMPLDSVAADFSSDPTGASETLLKAFEADYVVLARRLAICLKSRDSAVEALHDTYVKLRAGPTIGPVRNSRAYLYRMALNLAKNRRRGEARIVPFPCAAFLSIPDPTPGQDRVVASTGEMHLALTGLRSLPPKRRQIFLAKWRDEKTQAEIAAEFGMHIRSVQKELAKAEATIRTILRTQSNF